MGSWLSPRASDHSGGEGDGVPGQGSGHESKIGQERASVGPEEPCPRPRPRPGGEVRSLGVRVRGVEGPEGTQ